MKCFTIHANPNNFEASLRKMNAYLAKPGDKEISLALAGGRYLMTEASVLDAREFPGRCRLRLIGAGAKRTVLSSLRNIPAERFVKEEGQPYYSCRFEKDAAGQYPPLRAFYADGKLAKVASSKVYRTTGAFTRADGTEYAPTQDNWNLSHALYVPAEAVLEAGALNCRGAELHLRIEWEYKIYHIDRIDMADEYTDERGKKHVMMYLRKEETLNGNPSLPVCDREFMICNTTSVLKRQGDYAYDRSTGILSFLPEKDIFSYSFGLGGLTHLIDWKNFDSLTFEGLSFTGLEDDILPKIGYYAADQAGAWSVFPDAFPFAGAICIENVNRLELHDCDFSELPCDGIAMKGLLNNCSLRHNRFRNIGATAIRVGKVKGWSDDNQITDLDICENHLESIGFLYENSCAIFVSKARNARILHNTLLRTSYTGISMGWKWDRADWSYGETVNLENVEIAYNYIKSFLNNLCDGGGIYVLGGNTEVHAHSAFLNRIHDNVVIEDELTCPQNGFFGSIYHDGASSNWHTYNNIVVHNRARANDFNNSGRLYLQNAWFGLDGTGSTAVQASWHILCENNYICGCINFGEVFRSAADPEKASDMLDVTRDNREKDTHLLKDVRDLKKHPEALQIMRFSGCGDVKIKKVIG